MKYFLAVIFLIGVASARPAEDSASPPFHQQFHGDVDGSYSFSYAGEDSSKVETRHADGTVIGGYQYIDDENKLQKVQYKAGEEGVQILASNLPVGSTEPVTETPEVARATEEHYHDIQKALQLIARAAALEEEYRRLHPELEFH